MTISDGRPILLEKDPVAGVKDIVKGVFGSVS